jgi:branched-subunit amino acid aminotransferase/4-amino-4-deoxychorismate lyase
MARAAYVDGQYLPPRSATVHIEDRGYQFAVSLLPVVGIHGNPVGSAGPGPLSQRLRAHYLARAMEAA